MPHIPGHVNRLESAQVAAIREQKWRTVGRGAAMKKRAIANHSAYGAAAIRAMEAFVPAAQRLFDDEVTLGFFPPAARFLLRRAKLRAALGSLLEKVAPGIPGALLCRTRRIDDAVRDAVRRELPALVILGAGLDTRPYRLSELAEIKIVEMDLPALQEFKKTCLLRVFGSLPRHVRFVPVDFNTERLNVALERAALNPCEPAMFVWEGVSQYLQPSAADSVLRTIAQRSQGTVLAFTYILEEVITGIYRTGRSKSFRKSARRRPEPWYFGIDPSQLRTFLAARGLTLRHDFDAQQHQADYLLPLGRKMEVSEVERVAIASV
jgi:methyltransferase (TIGR00027 family)